MSLSIYSVRTAKVFAIVCFFLFGACKKLVEVDPPINILIDKEIFSSDATAASVLTGISTNMSNFSMFSGQSSISLRMGLYADELVTTSDPTSILAKLYLNDLTNEGNQLFWKELYVYIFKINSAIEGISESRFITEGVRKQLLGEALFLRAFMYFNLINLYGDVPLILTTSLENNKFAQRSARQEVMDQIIKDLTGAKSNLTYNYVKADASTVDQARLRPNKDVATALLAKVYLYNRNWQLAEEEASQLIDNSQKFELEELDNVFLISSKEAIWQLQPIYIGRNTLDAEVFILKVGGIFSVGGPNGESRPVYMSDDLYNAFESGDNRKSKWVDTVRENGITYAFPNKYKAWLNDQPRTEYQVVFRLAEQYLIRAEARIQLGRLVGNNSGESDLNIIRNRAGLTNTAAQTKEELLNVVLRERRVELFTEYGNRWMDLNRSGSINELMSDIAMRKGGNWNSYKALLPIPTDDIRLNPSLRGHQNPGYPEI